MSDIDSRAYYYVDLHATKEASVCITVDWDKLAKALAQRVVRSKAGKATALGGAVVAQVRTVHASKEGKSDV